MEPTIIIVGISAFVAGAVTVKVAEKTGLSKGMQEAEEKRKSIIENATLEAKNIKQEALLNSQSEIENIRSKFDKERDVKQSDLDAVDKRLIAKESKLDQKFDNIELREKSCNKKFQDLDNRYLELDKIEVKQKSELERISKLSQDEAKEQLLKKIESNLEYEHAVKIKEYAQLFKEQATKKANWLLAEAMQRCSMEYTAEALVSVVTLPNDEMKGRIIGRDGRNIRAFENLTGIDVIVDDTPEAVVLSGFNAIKREIARMTMEKLIQDGRIHPAKIEQVIEQSQKELFDTIREAVEHSVHSSYDISAFQFQ